MQKPPGPGQGPPIRRMVTGEISFFATVFAPVAQKDRAAAASVEAARTLLKPLKN